MNRIAAHLKENWIRHGFETLVVIIGILIVFSLNTWNENRKNTRLEQDYYCRLLEDVAQDAIINQDQFKKTERRLEASNSMLALLQKENPDNKEVVRAMLSAIAGSSLDYQPTQSAFDDIKSSGNLNIIKDLEFKKSLSEYMATLAGIMSNYSNNSLSLAEKLFSLPDHTQVMEIGLVQNGFDFEIIDAEQLNRDAKFTTETIKLLKSRAVFFIIINSRNLVHLRNIESRILEMQKLLETKCAKE